MTIPHAYIDPRHTRAFQGLAGKTFEVTNRLLNELWERHFGIETKPAECGNARPGDEERNKSGATHV